MILFHLRHLTPAGGIFYFCETFYRTSALYGLILFLIVSSYIIINNTQKQYAVLGKHRRRHLCLCLFYLQDTDTIMIQNTILQTAESVVHPKHNEIPLIATRETLTLTPSPKILPHFHDDLELIHILKGNLSFIVNSDTLLLQEGDCLVVNANQSHYCMATDESGCTYNCIIFTPEILTANEFIRRNFISSFLENTESPFLWIPGKTLFAGQAGIIINKIVELSDSDNPARSLEQIGRLHIFFGELYSYNSNCESRFAPGNYADDSCLKSMISYMKTHYADKISLDDIAEAGHVSRSKCCRIFKTHASQTPIAMLNFYRLEVSKNLLKNTDETIAVISKACGFPNQSYYNKVFMESYKCTPKEYRRIIKRRFSNRVCAS